MWKLTRKIIFEVITFLEPSRELRLQGDNQLKTQGQTGTSKKRLNGRPWLICCRLGREEGKCAIEAGNVTSADVVRSSLRPGGIAGTRVGGRQKQSARPLEGSLHRIHWMLLGEIEGRAGDLRKSPLLV